MDSDRKQMMLMMKKDILLEVKQEMDETSTSDLYGEQTICLSVKLSAITNHHLLEIHYMIMVNHLLILPLLSLLMALVRLRLVVDMYQYRKMEVFLYQACIRCRGEWVM